jgi:hypothetical protein
VTFAVEHARLAPPIETSADMARVAIEPAEIRPQAWFDRRRTRAYRELSSLLAEGDTASAVA